MNVKLGQHLDQNLIENWGLLIFATAYLGCGFFVFLKRPQEPAALALLLSGSGAFFFNIAGAFPLHASDLADPAAFWFVRVTITGSVFVAYTGLIHFALVFPRGPQFVAHRPWLLPAIYIGPFGFYTAYLVFNAFQSATVADWFATWWDSGLNLTLLLLLSSLPAIVLVRYVTLRAADDRHRLRALLASGLIIPLISLGLNRLPVSLGHPPLLDNNGRLLLYTAFPLVLGASILCYRLWNIEVIINHAVVYSALTLMILANYTAIVVVVGQWLGRPGDVGLSVLATELVAIGFHPARGFVQRAVNRLMYGERDDPYTVIKRLSRRLETTFWPEAVLPTIVETVAQSLKLPYAGLAVRRGDEYDLVASYTAHQAPAVSPPTLVRFPLLHQAVQVGELIVAPRQPSEPLTAADRDLIGNLVWSASLAVYNSSLTSSLVQLSREAQRSRERIVGIRAEERRRLSRDLHDGLGPMLAGVSFNLRAARNLLQPGSEPAAQLLAEIQTYTQSAIDEIKRLVYELRPPLLDTLGLIGAIQYFAEQYTADVGADPATALQIELDAPTDLPLLPAAVEVAAYRIALEALTNVVRHAQARRCMLKLSLQDHALDLNPLLPFTARLAAVAQPASGGARVLCVDVRDDGLGFDWSGNQMGLGLTSMRERAAELGGYFALESSPGRGTRIIIYLPLTENSMQRSGQL